MSAVMTFWAGSRENGLRLVERVGLISTGLKHGIDKWEERFYARPPPGSNFRDCKCARIETKASIHHPLWVVMVVYKIVIHNKVLIFDVGLSMGGLCIYVYIYIYTHTYIYIYIYIYICIHTQTYVYMYIYIHTERERCMMCMCVCVYIYIYMYIHTHANSIMFIIIISIIISIIIIY